MKTYWTYDNKEIKVGDVIDGETITRVTSNGLYTDPLETRSLASRDWYGVIIGPFATRVKRIIIPDVVPFDRITGKRLTSGMLTNVYNARIAAVNNGYTAIQTSDGRPFVLRRSTQLNAVEAGVEMRNNPTVKEYLTGLPRIRDVRCAEGQTDYFVSGIRNVKIPAEDAVWTGRCYRRVYEYKTDVTGELRLPRAIPANWLTTHDGLVGPPDSIVELADGRMEITRRAHYMDGKWYARAELLVYYNQYGDSSFVLSPPDNAVALSTVVDSVTVTSGYAHPEVVETCAATGRQDLRQHMVRVERRYYSQSYWSEHGRYCDTCGRAFVGTDDCDCEECRAGARARIRNYSNRSANTMRAEKDVSIKFGIELEVGCDKDVGKSECASILSDAFDAAGTDPTAYCVYKHDGSLEACDGFEIVTRPDCPSVHKRIFDTVLRQPKIRKSMSSFDNGCCGMHIHVSRAPLSDLWVGRLLVLVNDRNMQPLLHAVAGRSGNRYTNYDSSKKLTSKGSDRYEALNVTSDTTIEFRMFKGTLHPVSFIKNIEFVEAALAYTRPAARSLRDINNAERFTEFVSKDRKSYPNLFQFLTSKGLCHTK